MDPKTKFPAHHRNLGMLSHVSCLSFTDVYDWSRVNSLSPSLSPRNIIICRNVYFFPLSRISVRDSCKSNLLPVKTTCSACDLGFKFVFFVWLFVSRLSTRIIAFFSAFCSSLAGEQTFAKISLL